MAFLYGAYTVSGNYPGGVPADDDGKVIEIWRKQSDGSWKCAVDGWSSDLPARK